MTDVLQSPQFKPDQNQSETSIAIMHTGSHTAVRPETHTHRHIKMHIEKYVLKNEIPTVYPGL